MDDPDLVDAAHDAPHLRNRGPGKMLLRVKRLQPALKVKGRDILRRLIAPVGDEIVADYVLHDGGGVLRLGANGVLPKVGDEVMLGKRVEPNALRGGGGVDAEGKTQPVRLAPSVLFPREIAHEPDGQGVLHPAAVLACDPEPEHPGVSLLARHFLE